MCFVKFFGLGTGCGWGIFQLMLNHRLLRLEGKILLREERSLFLVFVFKNLYSNSWLLGSRSDVGMDQSI